MTSPSLRYDPTRTIGSGVAGWAGSVVVVVVLGAAVVVVVGRTVAVVMTVEGGTEW